MDAGDQFTWPYTIAGHPVEESSDESDIESEILAGALRHPHHNSTNHRSASNVCNIVLLAPFPPLAPLSASAIQQSILSISAPPSASSSLLPTLPQLHAASGLENTVARQVPMIARSGESSYFLQREPIQPIQRVTLLQDVAESDKNEKRLMLFEHLFTQLGHTVSFTASQNHATDFGECPVCRAEFQSGDKVRMQPCLHKFHDECLTRSYHQAIELVLNNHGVDSSDSALRNRVEFKCPVCKMQLNAREDLSEDEASSNIGIPGRHRMVIPNFETHTSQAVFSANHHHLWPHSLDDDIDGFVFNQSAPPSTTAPESAIENSVFQGRRVEASLNVPTTPQQRGSRVEDSDSGSCPSESSAPGLAPDLSVTAALPRQRGRGNRGGRGRGSRGGGAHNHRDPWFTLHAHALTCLHRDSRWQRKTCSSVPGA